MMRVLQPQLCLFDRHKRLGLFDAINPGDSSIAQKALSIVGQNVLSDSTNEQPSHVYTYHGLLRICAASCGRRRWALVLWVGGGGLESISQELDENVYVGF